MRKVIIAKLLLLALLCSNLNAQDTEKKNQKEVGIRFQGLNYFDFVYKKQKDENKFSRLRLASTRLSISEFENFNSNFSLGVIYGRENRKSIKNNFQFIRGWEIIGKINSPFNKDKFLMTLTPGIGLVLGFQYDFNERFLINIEATPSLTTDITYYSKDIEFSNLQFNLNTNNVALGLLYKF